MAAVPIYVWNGTAWQETGPVIPASPIKYQASAPSSPSTGDIWIDSDADVTTGSQQFQRFRFVASGGETSVSGVDANGAVLAYTAGTEIVVLNGSTLVRGSDYTATNGTSITGLSPALVASDVLEVFSFMAFNVANTYTQSQVDALVSDAPGLKLIVPTSVANGTVSSTGAVTFSSTSASVSLRNVFSSTYLNYRIIINMTGQSNGRVRLQIGNGGVANGDAVHGTQNLFIRGITVTANLLSGSSLWQFPGEDVTQGWYSIDIFQPFEVNYTRLHGNGATAGGSGLVLSQFSGSHDNFTSYSDLFIFPSTGTMTGSIRVYGYKN